MLKQEKNIGYIFELDYLQTLVITLSMYKISLAFYL